MTAGRGRATALALTVTAAVGVAAISGAATAAKQTATKPPAKRALSASGTALAFNKKSLKAPRGRVQLVLTNRSDIEHDVSIRGNGLKAKYGKTVGKGGVSRVTAAVKPGRYTYFCSVSGHEAAGMKGTLTIPRPK